MAENNTQPAVEAEPTTPAAVTPAVEAVPADATPATEPAVITPAEVTAASRSKQTAEDLSFPVDQEILDILNFDPFPGGELPPEPAVAEGAETPPAAAPQQPSGQQTTDPAHPAEGTEAVPVTALPADPATTPAAPAATAPTADPQTVALQTQVQSLTAALAAAQSSTKAPAAAPDAKVPDAPDYMFSVPDQLLQLMGSEDPNQVRQGLQALMSGLGQSMHKIVMQAVDEKLATVPSMISQGQQVLAQRQIIFEDFYKAHPDLNQPALHSVVSNVGAQVQAEMGAQAWSPQLRDAIAVRVRQSLGLIQGTTQVAPAVPVPAPVTPAAVPKPPAMIGSGVSPAPKQAPILGDEILDLFG